jgi:hypothetical protein
LSGKTAAGGESILMKKPPMTGGSARSQYFDLAEENPS